MNIVMFTNTFTPHVGGVARSVDGLARGLRKQGHHVLVVAPQFAGASADEQDVIRIPAVQKFGGSDFSVPLPLTRSLSDDLSVFQPDIVHSHHPFLLGDTALRVSAARNIPIVFTFHTRYELYGHYVAQGSEALKRLVLSLSLGYCDLCNAVIAPSESIAIHLMDHDVRSPVTVIPTGIDIAAFRAGSRARARRALGIPDNAFVVGHVGRLAPEKNLTYLTLALTDFLKANAGAICVITGGGPSRAVMAEILESEGVDDRVRFTGVLTGQALSDIYACLDVFAFSSKSETQGLVLVEAMAAGIPVIALDAPGAREVVRDGVNGRLLDAHAPADAFALALSGLAKQDGAARERMSLEARRTADGYSAEICLDRVVSLYEKLGGDSAASHKTGDSAWQTARRTIAREVDIFSNIARAVGDAVLTLPADDKQRKISTE